MASNAPKTKRDEGGQSAKTRNDKKQTPPVDQKSGATEVKPPRKK